jgi:hypothetical protein
VRFQVLTAASMKFRVLWAVAPCSHVEYVSELRTATIIWAMMEAVRTSETSVNVNVTTRRYFPEDLKLHERDTLYAKLIFNFLARFLLFHY